jgi:hypothetical protein
MPIQEMFSLSVRLTNPSFIFFPLLELLMYQCLTRPFVFTLKTLQRKVFSEALKACPDSLSEVEWVEGGSNFGR